MVETEGKLGTIIIHHVIYHNRHDLINYVQK